MGARTTIHEPRLDVHQHVWTAPLLDALARRRALPFVERSGALWTLHSAGELPYAIDPAGEAPDRRRDLLGKDGLDGALVAISSPIGIERLPREQARELIDAHLAGVAALGPRFAAWGPLALDGCRPEDVDELLARECAGISLPASALAGHASLTALGPVLARIAERGAVLFVHPGPAGPVDAEAASAEPPWWAALTGYVAQMQAAWLAFAALGRPEHPELVVLFSMLAGCAPLQGERLATRGGPAIDLHDPRCFYDTSSYGPAAVTAIAARVGAEQLVYGSDRPVLEPMPTGLDPALGERAGRLLGARAPAALRRSAR